MAKGQASHTPRRRSSSSAAAPLNKELEMFVGRELMVPPEVFPKEKVPKGSTGWPAVVTAVDYRKDGHLFVEFPGWPQQYYFPAPEVKKWMRKQDNIEYEIGLQEGATPFLSSTRGKDTSLISKDRETKSMRLSSISTKQSEPYKGREEVAGSKQRSPEQQEPIALVTPHKRKCAEKTLDEEEGLIKGRIKTFNMRLEQRLGTESTPDVLEEDRGGVFAVVKKLALPAVSAGLAYCALAYWRQSDISDDVSLGVSGSIDVMRESPVL